METDNRNNLKSINTNGTRRHDPGCTKITTNCVSKDNTAPPIYLIRDSLIVVCINGSTLVNLHNPRLFPTLQCILKCMKITHM